MDNQLLMAAYEQWKRLALQECFDPAHLTSRATEGQQEVFSDIGKIQYRWVTAGNQSGKSSIPPREISWMTEGTHPFWKRPENWGTEPLLFIIAGQDRKMMELELWSKKIKPFLIEGEWREMRVGGSLQYVEHKKRKDKIVFLSHNDSSDKARSHMQGYVAHYVWMDEMPSDIRIVEELQRRVDSRRGYFIGTFTAKRRNEALKRIVDNASLPLAKRYILKKLDNPIFKGREDEELQKLDGYPEAYRNAVLYGEWYTGDNAVYQWDRDTMVEAPEAYSPGWRHVEASDPAIQSQFGFTLWAESPLNGIWYCIKADYISGIATPEKIVREVMRRTEGYNIVRRISDPHEAWYINTAQELGIRYMSPYNKNNRKGELIKNLQSALSGKIRIAPWCRDLIAEFESCQWSESGNNKIIGASSYHLLDAAQYMVDCTPRREEEIPVNPWWTELRKANRERKKSEKLARTLKIKNKVRWITGPKGSRRIT